MRQKEEARLCGLSNFTINDKNQIEPPFQRTNPKEDFNHHSTV